MHIYIYIYIYIQYIYIYIYILIYKKVLFFYSGMYMCSNTRTMFFRLVAPEMIFCSEWLSRRQPLAIPWRDGAAACSNKRTCSEPWTEEHVLGVQTYEHVRTEEHHQHNQNREKGYTEWFMHIYMYIFDFIYIYILKIYNPDWWLASPQ